jgi:putative SOS response-associated peptidase YedK
MCYFFSQADEAVKVQKRFQAKLREGKIIAPMQKAVGFSYPELPVVIRESEDIIDIFNWGLIPAWVKSQAEAERIRSYTINARSESLFEKPSFSSAIYKRRCLVPATGFYEWQHQGKIKIPYFLELIDKSLFAFGGIWDEWVNQETGEIKHSFSIITTEANPLMAEIHNSKKRMPLILPFELESIWLQNDLTKSDIMDIMKPFNENLMSAIKL